MRYEVYAVADDEMPEGVDRVIVERECGHRVLLLSGMNCQFLAGTRKYEDEHTRGFVRGDDDAVHAG